MRTFNTGRITFEYPDEWEVEKADILSNPDCIATLSKGSDNLINAVMFPTATNLDDYKIFMEDAISDDGGVIIASDFVEISKLGDVFPARFDLITHQDCYKSFCLCHILQRDLHQLPVFRVHCCFPEL